LFGCLLEEGLHESVASKVTIANRNTNEKCKYIAMRSQRADEERRIMTNSKGEDLMSFRILSFIKEHLEATARLFTRRYKEMRSKLVILPGKYENKDLMLPLLENLVDEGPGVVAMRDTRLVGFLIGQVLANFRGRRSVWSPEWANSAEIGDSKEIYQGMYGILSSKWVADGCFNHIVTVLADNCDGIDGWFWESFGMMAVDALRAVKLTR